MVTDYGLMTSLEFSSLKNVIAMNLDATVFAVSWRVNAVNPIIFLTSQARVPIVKANPPLSVIRRMKKYEIYLPLKYNDGTKIETEKIKQIREELVDVFGARTVSSQHAPYQGAWNYRGSDIVEDIIKIEIIARADRKTQTFFRQFKERLKRLLKQIDVLIIAQDVRLI
jgi:hypothetical protein